MRDTQPSSRDLRTTARWIATLALLLGGCLNPRPEELPSAQGVDGDGNLPGNANEIDVPSPAVPAPANPGPSVDANGEEPAEPAKESPEPPVDPDAGTHTSPDAGTPDAGG